MLRNFEMVNSWFSVSYLVTGYQLQVLQSQSKLLGRFHLEDEEIGQKLKKRLILWKYSNNFFSETVGL